MNTYQVVEKFVSINGEGKRAGELALFIRFKGCNLQCSYCDTAWANTVDCEAETMTLDEVLAFIEKMGVRNITLTGGEPLLREGMKVLVDKILENPFYRIEVETNGSIDLFDWSKKGRRPSFTMDYKLPESGMEQNMKLENFSVLTKEDSVKFVVSSGADMERAYELILQHKLQEKTTVFFSPVFGRIQPVEMVEFLIRKKLNDVKIQLQMHKVIWEPDKRGV